MKQQVPEAQSLGLAKVPDLILALKSHKISGIVAEDAVALAYVQNDSSLATIKGKFNIGGDEVGSAIGFSKGATSW